MTQIQFQTKLVGLQDNLFSFALTLTANKEDAMDLLQDTTLKVLDNRDKFTDNTNFKGWVMTVMRNIFINNYNRVVRTNTFLDSSIDVYNVDTISHSGFDSPEGCIDMNEINNAIEGLSEDMKAPFALFVSGYRYDEISDIMNIPMGTVKSRIFVARQRLQNELKEFYYN
ncbi:RNA polymerase sigma factor (sigma-70 family) [Parabacteroides sp. PFB2-12]|uniref:RNA polymerase sigma factor n=1 Tax=unclassified Parabacteroides TaxID=2649774 RepID=UPI002475E83F|nr:MULTISPECIES: sigma-70 family RNA polymerase sigma factor [unclassified Parabacteroides]MDH6342067.1 RNA polymerase sigma factor (sigma-70 family) [Parabacteroides sp. PM6-13]MDH6389486.1 RNA polymerase sigma factor (sigma-70 family) [Parabacteroides sp. PFB2-12]